MNAKLNLLGAIIFAIIAVMLFRAGRRNRRNWKGIMLRLLAIGQTFNAAFLFYLTLNPIV